jgi:hypothetical protein
MNANLLMFFDVPPVGGVIGLFAAAAFFVICMIAAITAFFVLKKTLKMAFRVAIVAVILAVAVIGGISFVWLGLEKSSPRPRPGPPRPAPTRTP